MTDVSNTEWAVVIIIFAFMCGYSFVLGALTSQALLRLESRDKGLSYQKWGVTKELFQPKSVALLIGAGILSIVITTFAFYLAFLATELITEDTTTNNERLMYTLWAAIFVALIGFMIESRRVKQITDKTEKLDDLREVFHQRLSPAELLSVYEALSPAPPLFWEEYAGLPVEQVSKETNRRFREIAAPYGHSRSIRYNRIVIAVMLVTLLLAAIGPAIDLLG